MTDIGARGFGGPSHQHLTLLQVDDVRVRQGAARTARTWLQRLPEPHRDRVVPRGWRAQASLAVVLAVFGLYAEDHPDGSTSVTGTTGDWVTRDDLVALDVLAPYLPRSAWVVVGGPTGEPLFGLRSAPAAGRLVVVRADSIRLVPAGATAPRRLEFRAVDAA